MQYRSVVLSWSVMTLKSKEKTLLNAYDTVHKNTIFSVAGIKLNSQFNNFGKATTIITNVKFGF